MHIACSNKGFVMKRMFLHIFVVLVALMCGVDCVGAAYTKDEFKEKIRIEYKNIFDQMGNDEKGKFLGEQGQENNFNVFVEAVRGYFVDNLNDDSDFLKKNVITSVEAGRTGLFRFFGSRTIRTANVGLNTYLLELLKNAFNDLVYSGYFYTNPQGTLTENLTQYYELNDCNALVVLYSQLFRPNEFNAVHNEQAKHVVRYVLENILALIPRRCWLALEKEFDRASGKYFLDTLFELRMEGALRKYLYFYKHLSFAQNIQFRLIRHGILMNAMADFVAAADIVKKYVVGKQQLFNDNQFLTKKIIKYVYDHDFIEERNYSEQFPGLDDKDNQESIRNYLTYRNYLDKAESLANYLIGQINNSFWYYLHQHRYKTALLTGLGVGSMYLLIKHRHRLQKLFKKPEQKIEVPFEEEITLPEVSEADIPPVPESTGKSWREWFGQYVPRPWESKIEPIPEPKLEYPHE